MQKEPHLNGGSELSPRVPVEVPPMVEPIEPEPEEPEIPSVIPATIVPEEETIKIPEPEIVQPVEPLVPAVEEVQTVSGSEEKSEEPPVVAAVPVTVSAVQQPVTVPETNEKPTYANLFKKSGSAVVATGSISLPPAGFGKRF